MKQYSPLSLTVVISDPAVVKALHIRVYKSPHTPTAAPDSEATVDAPVEGFLPTNTIDLSGSGLFDNLEGFHVDISVAEVASAPPESAETFADNPSQLVSVIVPAAPPVSVHINA